MPTKLVQECAAASANRYPVRLWGRWEPGMEPYHYAIVGAGWRTEFFLRINAAMPEQFCLAGVVVRRPERARELEAKFGVKTFPNTEALLDFTRPEFWVDSVSYGANFAVNQALIETGVPLLTETPPAASLEEMEQLWETAQRHQAQVQVAEQFHRQPLHAARLAAIQAGKIGTAHTAYVSLCHGYHATSLLRMFLGVTFQEARIVGMGWTDRVRDSGGRDGAPVDPQVKESPQQIALLDFGDGRHGVFDFSSVQYFSPLRAQRVCVRGEQGEITDQTLLTLNTEGEPLSLPFERKVAGPNGNLEGHHLKGIQLGEQWIYRNRTAPARLSDEEIAMAEMLLGMGEYVRGGPEVYPLALAMQDHYLGLLIRQACESGAAVTATRRAWASE